MMIHIKKVALIVLAAALVFSVLSAITFGNADISLQEVYHVVACELFQADPFSAYAQGAVHDVVWLIRFPRTVLALAVGMGLSVCGVVMQAIMKNPLADPYILGVSSGATLGATLAIMLGIGSIFGGNFVGLMAFLGAFVSSLLVMAIANAGGRASAGRLILSGTAVSSICSACSNFILYIINDSQASSAVMRWMMGSLSGADWERVLIVLLPIVVCTCIFWTQYRSFNLMLLGDETAITLGTNLHKKRIVSLLLASLVVGFAVYAAGMIGFVGLVIPHIVRILFGTDHKWLIPLSALMGGIFLIWADVACRIILKNAEMPIGIFVSVIGAPCFLYLLVRRSYGFSR